MKTTFEKKTIFSFIIAAIVLVLVMVMFFRNSQKLKLSADWVEHTQEVLKMNDKILIDVLNIEANARSYLLTGNQSFLKPVESAVFIVKSDIASLSNFTKDNIAQQARIDSLKKVVDERIIISQQIIDLKRQNTLKEAEKLYIISKGNILTDKIRIIIKDINSEEFRLLGERKKENEANNKNSQLIFSLLLALVVVVFVLIIVNIKTQKTKNRFAEKERQVSQYSRSLIEASLDPLVTISIEGTILDVNNASVKVTGVERENLIDTDFSNYFTEPEKAQEGYRQVFEKGFVSDYPLTIKHKNGKLTDVLYNASVYKDENGNVLGVFAAARDVTQQKQASQYARSLIEASLDPLVTISVDGKILDVNAASATVTGVERENLIDTDFSNYFTEPEKAQEGYRQVFEKGFVADYPLTIKHKNGKLTDVLYNASVYKDEKGNVLGVFAAARDVTKQKIAEQLLQKSLREVSDYKFALQDSYIVAMTDAKGIINFANENFSKISGYSTKELIGQDHRILNSGYHTKEFFTEMYATISKGKIWRGEIKNKAKNGSYYWVDSTIVPFVDENNKPYQYVAIRIDITDRKKAQTQLEEVNKELEAFSYSVSHDLRAPLRAINGYAKILQEDYVASLDEAGMASLNSILNNSRKMGELIDDLLAFSRLGRKVIATSEINMKVLVNAVKEEELLNNVKEIEFETKELLPAKGQQALIKQIWVNLISNAVKYSKHKTKIIIEIGSYYKDNLVVYYIKDNGAGFDMQYYDKLFGVFQRLHSAEEFEGTGIGLAIVQKIIARHNGTVWAESKVNEGSTFYFSLPTINS